ncbi:hypothetical protein [Halorarius halobius]|uniref:hypothetical protein n=1 Tax=Halorarius halobius TaxID=2962671 RepID=UPI0020CD6A29|nr:hypothetical protein [Halorarius halobius]
MPEELTDTEREALHALELGVEHVHRAFGALVECHHETGRAMDRFETARRKLRAAGHDEFADRLRDDLLPRGAVDDRWTYELVEAFDDQIRADAVDVEKQVRERLAGGERHVTEKGQKRAWRRRADR